MGHDLTHHEIEELLGAYALDAVEPQETLEIEEHLRGCPRCRTEVGQHREMAALLAHAGQAAPGGVWARIAASLEEAKPGPAPAPVMTPGPRVRALPRRAAAAVAAAVAAAAVVSASLLGLAVAHQGNRLHRLTATLGNQGLGQAALSAAVDPAARHVELRSGSGEVLLTAVVLPDGTGYAVPRGLPRLSRDQTYQLWGITGDQRVSLALLGAGPVVQQFHAPDQVKVLAVTEERAGGAIQPTRAPAAFGDLGGR